MAVCWRAYRIVARREAIVAALLCIGLTSQAAQAQAPAELVRDIDDGLYINLGSEPRNFTAVGSTVFFYARHPDTGRELWRTNGTPDGSRLVADVVPGVIGSETAGAAPIDVNGTLFLFVNRISDAGELWKTDGTLTGTALVKDIAPGPTTATLLPLANLDGTLLFQSFDSMLGWQLWRSDGTEPGTVWVKDLPVGGVSSPTVSGGKLFFAADDPFDGTELWISDGTTAGTHVVKDIRPGFFSSFPRELTDVNGTLFFVANDGLTDFELWASDGTEMGTGLVRDIALIGSGNPSQLVSFSGELYFAANADGEGGELWKSDGTEAGTGVFKDLNPGSGSSHPYSLAASGSTLFFGALLPPAYATNGLWRSDGTAAGTIPLGGSPPLGALTGDGDGNVYYVALDPATGAELHTSDGSPAGTRLLRDIFPGSAGSGIASLTASNGAVYFAAYDNTTGNELWRADQSGATLLRDIMIDPIPTPLELVGGVNGKLLFNATTIPFGQEPWVSDGTPGGTSLLADLAPSSATSSTQLFAKLGSDYLFFTNILGTGSLWKTGGTPGDTQLLASGGFGLYVSSGTSVISPDLGGYVLFQSTDAVAGRELFRSDGTPAGSSLLKDICSGACQSSPGEFAQLGAQAIFSAYGSLASGRELFISDGTDAGTAMVKDICPGSCDSNPLSPVVGSGIAYFRATDLTRGAELWRSDGTEAGTTIVKDIEPGVGSSNPALLTEAGSSLFFVATTAATGTELWTTDGTGSGTQLVKDIIPGSAGSSPTSLRELNGVLYFVADDGISGAELWRSDGTEAGTYLVKDIRAGSDSSNPAELVNANGRLFFRAADGEAGAELWRSDGTTVGTIRIADVWPGATSSTPSQLTLVDNTLYFVATDPVVSTELFRLRHATTCGDGVPHAGESCDDGNLVNGDGCDVNCTLSACGNGALAPSEACDDGNTSDSDACTSACQASACGDGATHALFEGCDDGNGVNGDGCDTNCLPSTCGNGAVGPGEECDLGIANGPTGACSDLCTLCGNGALAAGETCDDGNRDDGDGCDRDCRLETCWTCSGAPSLCSVNDGGACDDGAFCNGTDTCAGTACTVHSGDPCPGSGVCTGVCSESTDSCNANVGTPCDDDGNACTLDACDGAGACLHTPTSFNPCDDGSLCTAGDFCLSGTCGPGTTTECDDENPCTTDSCNPGSGACEHDATPRTSCRTGGKWSLAVSQKDDDTKDAVVFKLSKASTTTQMEFGDPPSSLDDSYALCVFDATGPIYSARIPAGAPNWSSLSDKGFRYKDKTGAQDGITGATLAGSSQDKTKILIKGKGVQLFDPTPEDWSLPVVVQVARESGGLCFEGSFATADQISKQDPTAFKAKASTP